MILNYTTKIASSKTVAEIQHILGTKGADYVSVDYAGGKASAVIFGFKVDSVLINFRLPCNVSGVSAALKKQKGSGTIWKNLEQCERIAWRIVKDWVEAQMALVEAQQAELGEVFLPYAVHHTGQSYYQLFKNNQLALSSGDTNG